MKHVKKIIAMLVFVTITTIGCKPDPLEYARPESLAGTVYPQLESLGIFNYYLTALDQTEFKEPLTKGGSWTVFAPTDEAFEQFMSNEGFASFDQIPEERLLHIIEYSIIVDAWNTTSLTYWSGQFYLGTSFRRRTQYKDPIVEVDAADYPNLIDWEAGNYFVDTSGGDNKTTDYFLQSYFDYDLTGAEPGDYAFMFPGETYNPGDMKVFESNVSQTNIIAENGMIYALDKVIEPKLNLYQNLSAEEYGGKYSMYKSILERFGYLNDVGEELNEETGELQTIHYLSFETNLSENLLPFDPNTEDYPRIINAADRTWANATGILVPTNDALIDYLNGDSVLGKFYDSYDDMPLDVLGTFLNTNFFTYYWSLCPSHFGQTFNMAFDLIDYKEEHIVDKQFCSNGLFVGVNTVYTNDGFATIMGPLLLDEEYSIMLKAVQDLGIDSALQSLGVKFSMFGIKNDQFVGIADPNSASRVIEIIDWEPDLSVIYMQVTENGITTTYPSSSTNPQQEEIDYVTTTINDIVLNQIIEEEVNLTADNFYQTKSGEFVYITANTVAGGGNIFNNEPVDVVSTLETANGNFYDMSTFIERPLVFTYGALTDNSATFSKFLELLEAADALVDIPNYDEDKLVSFLNLDRTFTLFAPNNAAIAQAITDGVIIDPDPSNLSTLTPLELATAKVSFLNFAKKHFLQQAITTDGITTGTFPSMYFDIIVDFVPVYNQLTIDNDYATSTLTVRNPTTAEVVAQTSSITNLLSKRVVIHEISAYIK